MNAEIRELEWKYYDPEDVQLKALLDFCPLRGKKVLEIGCGNGIFTLKLARHCHEILGVDFDEEMIESAKEKAVNENVNNARFMTMDAQDLKLKSNEYDIVICLWTINTIKHKEIALKEAKRVLRKGGKFLLVDFVEKSIHYELAHSLYPTQIKIMHSVTRYERPVKKVFGKIEKISEPIPIPIMFPNMHEALEEAVGELETWYTPYITKRSKLTESQRGKILKILQGHLDNGQVIVHEYIKLYLTTKK